MIDAKELRIGNWINYKWADVDNGGYIDKPMKISANEIKELSFSPESRYYSPIPLSPEVLKACGFEKLKGSKFVYRILLDDIEISVSTELHYAYIDTLWGQAPIKKPIFKSLHQLQNLYYALTQTELIYQPSKSLQ